jgi:uncharacterized protein (TIGR01615 family)
MQISSHVEKASLAAQHRGTPSSLKCVAGNLATFGYNVKLRSALGSRTRTDCLRMLKHTFLVVAATVDGRSGKPQARCSICFDGSRLTAAVTPAGTTVLVDLDFRQNFEIAKPTLRYGKLLESVPDVLVATEDTCHAVLQLLCAEMQQCFTCQGQFLPPWRELSSLLSKWLPQRFNDVSVLAEISSEDDDDLSPTSVLPQCKPSRPFKKAADVTCTRPLATRMDMLGL